MKALSFVCFLVAAVSAGVIGGINQNEAEVSDIERTGLYETRFCGMDEDGGCTWNAYGKVVGAIAGAVVLIGCCLCCSIEGVFCMRSVNKCGGANPTYGCICVDQSRSRPGYTAKQIRIAKLCGIVFALLPIPVCFSTLVLSGVANGHGSSFTESSEKFYTQQLKVAETVVLQMADRDTYSPNATTYLNDWTAHMVQVEGRAQTWVSRFGWGELGRVIVTIGVLAVVLLLTLLALSNALCAHKDCAHTVSLLLNVMLLFMFGALAFNVFFVLLVNDLCVELDALPSPPIEKAFAGIVGCNIERMQNLQYAIDESLVVALRSACKAYDKICSSAHPQPPATCGAFSLSGCVQSNVTHYFEGWETLMVNDTGTVRTFENCKGLCADRDFRNATNSISDAVDDSTYFLSVEAQFETTISCSFVANHLLSIEDTVCFKYRDALNDSTVSGVVASIIIIPLILMQMTGGKRFLKSFKALDPEAAAAKKRRGGGAQDLERALALIPPAYPKARTLWEAVVAGTAGTKVKADQAAFQRVFRREYPKEAAEMDKSDWAALWEGIDEDEDGFVHVDELAILLNDAKEDLPGAVLHAKQVFGQRGTSADRAESLLASALAVLPAEFPEARRFWKMAVADERKKNRIRHDVFQRIFRREYADAQYRMSKSDWDAIWDLNDEDGDTYCHVDELYMLLRDYDEDMPECIVKARDDALDGFTSEPTPEPTPFAPAPPPTSPARRSSLASERRSPDDRRSRSAKSTRSMERRSSYDRRPTPPAVSPAASTSTRTPLGPAPIPPPLSESYSESYSDA